jgi:hypothetical protein
VPLAYTTKLRAALSIALALASAGLLAACGSSGGSDVLSAGAVVKCVDAKPAEGPKNAPTLRRIVAKVVKGGWLVQGLAEEDTMEKDVNSPGWELFVFKDDKTAEEAFDIMRNVKETWDAAGAFRRKNVVIATDIGAPAMVSGIAEELLNRCAGKVASQSFVRPKQSEIP